MNALKKTWKEMLEGPKFSIVQSCLVTLENAMYDLIDGIDHDCVATPSNILDAATNNNEVDNSDRSLGCSPLVGRWRVYGHWHRSDRCSWPSYSMLPSSAYWRYVWICFNGIARRTSNPILSRNHPEVPVKSMPMREELPTWIRIITMRMNIEWRMICTSQGLLAVV